MVIVYRNKNNRVFHIIVDDDMEVIVSAYKWRANPAEKAGVPILRIVGSHKITGKIVTLNRLILNVFDRKKIITQTVEGLDFRRKNLNVINYSEYLASKQKSKKGTSQYFGVYKRPSGIYTASITKNGVTTYLGSSRDEVEAAKMYDMAAKKIHGKSARLNFL